MSSEILFLTADEDCTAALPALTLLPHRVRVLKPDPSVMLGVGPHDAVLVDARTDLAGARDLCRLLSASDSGAPVIAVVNEGGLIAVNDQWGVDELLLPTSGPAEVEARLRLLLSRSRAGDTTGGESLTVGDLVIEEATYTARLKGRALELTYKEFELLKYLAQHAGRVFTRVQLLQEVWGYDFFGGTRTVDVHIRRLRAKLGPEYDAMIGTVRNVGYKFVVPSRGGRGSSLRAPAGEAPVDETPVDERDTGNAGAVEPIDASLRR
ncbi:DNA-binding response OmpR family regulator [Halopolyspora algeriensis]|uniref:DNA-binding response OmpR family regulator n=1 Tax=Halopolyspora algeriensis TaxID=1500506 RepID=A0A368VYH3_9ACTN|nr:response regulator transcription factor [Halopolyspora algeriensis]RCW47037.1 DNA-binding response OmpR family regulator [Halopolyspora algeriensis]TQM48124.1 DNA-binding response OmpR family regulator [Halopolyspora algeriensis]